MIKCICTLAYSHPPVNLIYSYPLSQPYDGYPPWCHLFDKIHQTNMTVANQRSPTIRPTDIRHSQLSSSPPRRPPDEPVNHSHKELSDGKTHFPGLRATDHDTVRKWTDSHNVLVAYGLKTLTACAIEPSLQAILHREWCSLDGLVER